MTPVSATKSEDGKISISFHNWMVPVLLACAGLIINFVVGTFQSRAQASNLDIRVTRVEAQTENKVNKDEYKQAVQFLNEKTDRIDRNVQSLVDLEIHQAKGK